ncbi:cytochrome P450 ClCP1 [Amniculicola lignicola CBS 123094]|uniref:Cytochrome P450 ClCP1 n=1 Tax=Amniculicola lignicola CBS 123094 TaxID=1392246 RepID=A0A6A5WV59_9PLEO|nr:cytochrome P450 ClCP1 [Amniculicola lignicola CBS 123094]
MIDVLFEGGVLARVCYGSGLAIGALVTYILLFGIYNLTLHPLRSYPGPLLWRAYRIPWCISTLGGRFPFDVLEFHKKYGPVVRVAPDELSYSTSKALKPIYGHHNATSEGFTEFDKDRTQYVASMNGVWNILAARATEHGRFRRMFSHSFSEKGMRELQPKIQTYVELLIRGLKESAGPEFLDILAWYNWTTFDMIGDLAFGESFRCLEEKRTDPWIQAVFDNIKAVPIIGAIQVYGLEWLLPYLIPKRLMKQRILNFDRNVQMIEKRIEQGTSQGDFWDKVIETSDYEKGTGMTKPEMVANASILVLGGSETTATLLSGTTYLLLTNPEKLEKLQDEVRGVFNHEAEIDLMSVGKLDYMLAVLDEGMRIFPPVPNQGNRVVPAGGADVAGKWVAGGTSLQVNQYAANRLETNFTRPEAFVPERWLADSPEEFANDDRSARAAFSLGPRNCIGRNLAYAEMRLILAKVIYNFDIELDKERCGNWIGEQKIYGLWEKGPLYVKLTNVQH